MPNRFGIIVTDKATLDETKLWGTEAYESLDAAANFLDIPLHVARARLEAGETLETPGNFRRINREE